VCAPAFAAPTDIVIDDQKVFPESLSAAPDGTLYIGGSATGVIYVAKPGESHAKPWISKEQGDFHFVLGVLVDAPKHTLYVCDDIPADKKAWLKTFALSTGKPLKSYALPDGGLCNDIAINHGTAYITDTFGGRVLKLGPGAADLTVWYSDPSDPSLDGLVWADANTLYTNTYRSNHLIRIVKNKDGSAGKGEALNTSMPLFQPDGMRLSSDGRVLMIEGQGRPGAGLKEGRLDLVTVEGDSATITVLKSGFELPVAVTVVGPTAWVLESKFDFQRNEDLKGKDPGTFHAYAVPVPKGR
jgi:sugar lactone lactonase YvrE